MAAATLIMYKQGTNFIMPVHFAGYDLSSVSSIDFIFQQNDKTLEYTYPSETATLRSGTDDTIDLVWTEEDTWKFCRNITIKMDTKVHLVGSTQNPQTNIVEFKLSRTLFPRDGVSADG